MTQRRATDRDSSPIRKGVSIAVFNGRSVLLVKRGRPPFAGLWSLPGGKLQGDEAPREAAHRELAEETSVEADIEGVLDIVTVATNDDKGQRLEYRLTVLYARYRGGIVEPGDDAEAAQWVALDEIKRLPMTEGTAGLIFLAAHRLRIPPIG